jgi:hypothetical protein
MDNDRENIRFNALRNALYHTGRRLTFERWNRWCNFAVILLGAAAMADFAKGAGFGDHQYVLGGLVAAVGAAQLVFDFAGRARDHQALQRDYYHLLADIEEAAAPDESLVSLWRGRMIRIAGDEPPTYRALDAKAYNDAIGATEIFPLTERLHIPWHHRLFGAFWAFEGYDYRKIGELPAR